MKNDHYTSLRKLILGTMILLPFIPFILVIGIGYFYFTTSLESSTIASMKRIVDDHRQMISNFLAEREADLEYILYGYPYEDISNPEFLEDIFARLQSSSSAFVDIGVFNADGVHVAYNGPYALRGKVYRDEPWFKEVMEEGFYISDVFLGFRNIPHFVIALVREEAGRKWAIRATIDTYMFNDLVKKVRIGKTGEAYLLNDEGIFQTDRRSGGEILTRDPDADRYIDYHQGIRTFMQKDYRGEPHLYATTWMKNGQWLLVVRQEEGDAFAALRRAGHLILLITLIGGGAIVAAAFYLTEQLVRRMVKTDAEKGQLEEQLIRAHRLAELGEMAAGFAHEINNPLQIIKSEQSLVEMSLDELAEAHPLDGTEQMHEIRDAMNQIKLQINRCGGITQAILKFGRQTDASAQDVDLRRFIPEVTAMVSKKAGVHGIDLETAVAEETPFVHADPGQLQQVLLNLINNAMDAVMERHGTQGGLLRIEVGAGKNGKAEIRVRDNGSGISLENRSKIFSPFFTTKPVGQGTGLGLSVCYGIIHNLGGTMEVDSEPGDGTTFSIRLPGTHPPSQPENEMETNDHGKIEDDAGGR